MGFFFFAIAFVFLIRGRLWFFCSVALALVFGLLIGYARLVQGGHFPSDTVWAAAVCWFTSLGLYYAYGLHRQPFLRAEVGRKRPWWMLPAMFGGIVTILLIVAMATPYGKSQSYTRSAEGIEKVMIAMPGKVEITRSKGAIRYVSEGDGHRLPKSRHRLRAVEEGGVLTITMYKTGFFTELNLSNELTLPDGIEVVLPESE